MQTAAERQKRARARKKSSGNFRQLNVWILTEAFQSLTFIAKKQGQSQADALTHLLIDSANSTAISLASSNTKSSPDSKAPRKLKPYRQSMQNVGPMTQAAASQKNISKTTDQTQFEDAQGSLF